MDKKDLKSKLRNDSSISLPPLVRHYKDAIKEVYGEKTRVIIHAGEYGKFEEKQKELRDLGVPLRDYAYGVVVLLEYWVRKKGFEFLPVNVFLGDWVLSKFRKVYESEFVDFHYGDDSSELLYTELRVARYYIESSLDEVVRFRDCVEELRPVLSENWLYAYENDVRDGLVHYALEILEGEYDVSYALSYVDIVDKLILKDEQS